eukprot:TRINITY_DN6299_c0_g1_i4.p1 TRINITY_DN6299_c0_g1~~TRINITY_DN6299_c0_g1_i4.p1  ORF type:complete len:181 (+),score=16.46 TRINITY_DN6299_c0_g1_i4:192-734(+)
MIKQDPTYLQASDYSTTPIPSKDQDKLDLYSFLPLSSGEKPLIFFTSASTPRTLKGSARYLGSNAICGAESARGLNTMELLLPSREPKTVTHKSSRFGGWQEAVHKSLTPRVGLQGNRRNTVPESVENNMNFTSFHHSVRGLHCKPLTESLQRTPRNNPQFESFKAVSYTHLTLPTKRIV